MTLLNNIKKITFLISFSLLLTIIPIITYGDCGLATPSGDPEFGEVKIGYESKEESVSLRNTGNQIGTFSFTGAPWKNSEGTTIMTKTATHYSFTQGEDYANMNQVTNLNYDGITINKKNMIFMYLKVLVAWIPTINEFYGPITQDLALSLTC